MLPQLLSTYIGFCGQISDEPKDCSPPICRRVGTPGTPLLNTNSTVQWVTPCHDKEQHLSPQTLEGHLLLSGLFWNEWGSLPSLTEHVSSLLKRADFEPFALMTETSVGCYVETTPHPCTIYLWVGFAASNESVFYQINGTQVRWSTNPRDFVSSEADIDPWALRRCCHGDDVFISPSIQRVEQGHLVKISPGRSITDYQFDRFSPDPHLLAPPMTQERFILATQAALQHAVRPLTHAPYPVGVMLSGGIGSASLLAAMKQEHIPVIAYHMESPDPAGSEYHYAKMTCEALDIPLRRIEMDTSAHYLTFHHPHWVHPFGHPWARWYEQVAEQASQDGIRVLVIGGGDDSSFGPELEYSVSAILAARIPRREKARMIKGSFSTDWNAFAIIRSAWPWPPQQLIGLSSVEGHTIRDRVMRRADFLVPLPPRPRATDDAAILHAPRFAAQSLAIGQALQHKGIHLYYPYHHRQVQAVSLALPPAYRLVPRLCDLLSRDDLPDQLINKPILRLAWEHMLPAAVTWRTWSVYTQAAGQHFCLQHPELLATLLGADSLLAHLGITDPERVQLVLSKQALIRENYHTLIASSMVEIYLRQAQQHWKGGVAIWP